MTASSLPMYVSHDVDLPVHDLSLAIDALPERTACDGVTLTLDPAGIRRQPLLPCDPWRSRPASLRAGRLRPAFRVSLEAVPWSTTRSQVGIRPQSRACSMWTTSFHDAANTIAAHICRTSHDAITGSTPVAASGELACRVDDVAFDDGDVFALVKVAGDLHSQNSSKLHEEVIDPIDSGAGRILVDLAGVRTVDHVGIATLAALTQASERADAAPILTLTAVPGPVRDEIEGSAYAPVLKIA